MLDIEGVGLNDSPEMQGLGILKQIKKTNPAQMVILYSAKPQRLSYNTYLTLADVVLEKGIDYVSYKEHVDELLVKRSTPAYFIAAMNKQLGENAILAPKAVSKAARAFQRNDGRSFNRYIEDSLSDAKQIDTVIGIIQVGLATVSMFATA
jgi:predicted GTPase